MAVALRCLLVATAVLFVAGCPDLRGTGLEAPEAGEASPSEPGPYPHPEGWADPASHGSWAVPFKTTTCLKCHRIDSSGDKDPPACFSCHPLFPHEEGWSRKENHGEEVWANGRGACATQCHGTDLQGGLSGVSCNLCHATYPHPPGWALPAQHGEAARGLGSARCQPCHGADLLGGASGVSCFQCHSVYPHDPDWKMPDQHGSAVLASGTASCATQCHGPDLKGGLSGVGCNSCHNLYPHPDGWDVQHGPTAISLGNSACQACHGADFKTILDGKNCFSCHESYPHNDPNWTALTDPTHGSYVLTTLGNDKTPCQMCHGADFQGGHSETPCFTCHIDYPHVPGWDHGINAVAATGHIAECKKCHGTALNEAPAGYQSCLDCHESYVRHANADAGYSGWGTGGTDRHGTNFILDASHDFLPNTAPYGTTQARTAECRLCHGAGDQEFKGGISGRGCMDAGLGCHTTDKNPPGPSSNDNWPMMSFSCAVCHNHGSIFPTNTTCLACHSDVAAGHHGWDGIASCRASGCHDNIMP